VDVISAVESERLARMPLPTAKVVPTYHGASRGPHKKGPRDLAGQLYYDSNG